MYGNTMLGCFSGSRPVFPILNFVLVRAISDPTPDIEKAGIPIEKEQVP